MANYVKQLKDNDGNNIYPIAYTHGGMKMDLLWTNPAPTASFAAQTVSLDLSQYDLVYIKSKRKNDNSGYYGSNFVLIDGIQYSMVNIYGGLIEYRGFTPSESGIVFTNGSLYSTYATGSTNDSYMVPYQIYGIKMSYVVPTNVHGLQYVEVED